MGATTSVWHIALTSKVCSLLCRSDLKNVVDTWKSMKTRCWPINCCSDSFVSVLCYKLFSNITNRASLLNSAAWIEKNNSNKWLIYLYTFLQIIIILIYQKIYFHLYAIGEKKFIMKNPTFSLIAYIVLPESNLWFYYNQLCPASQNLIIHNADHGLCSFLSTTIQRLVGISITILIKLGY